MHGPPALGDASGALELFSLYDEEDDTDLLTKVINAAMDRLLEDKFHEIAAARSLLVDALADADPVPICFGDHLADVVVDSDGIDPLLEHVQALPEPRRHNMWLLPNFASEVHHRLLEIHPPLHRH